MEETNPFVFSRPLDPEHLIDREQEAEKLLALAEGGHATRLSAPRRYGKTSLLRRVGRDAEKIGFNYVEVDFYGVLSQEDVALRLERAYRSLRSAPRRAADAAIRALRPGVSIGAGPARVEARPSLDQELDSHRALVGLLDLPLEVFERTGTRTLVAFDEFQSLLAVNPQIDGLFRSRIQRHGDSASYIFAGSHPGLMEQLFGAYERPFFGQARVMRLGPLAGADLVEYIGERFEAGERDVTPVLHPFLDLVRGHPQRAMLLAHYLWEQTPRGEPATPERWQVTLRTVFSEYGEALQATWDALETKEKAVLAALALGEESLFSDRTLSRFNLSKGGVQHARDALTRSGHIHRVGDRWDLVDPLLAEWIVRLERGIGEDDAP
jgi:AAA+ ATPase superfamily predicted ATPase